MGELSEILGLQIPYVRVIIVCLWFSQLYSGSDAGWGTPPFEEDPDNLGGITVDFETMNIFLDENIGHSTGFALVKINLTGSHQVAKVFGDNRFSVVKNTENENWYFNVSGPFDYEMISYSQFFITLQYDNNTSDDLIFNVHVMDLNDNFPRIISKTPDPIPPIPEDATYPLSIVNITAYDDDKADNHSLIFSIKNDCSGLFSVRKYGQVGEVFLNSPLDNTIKTSYSIDIIIRDNREPFHFTMETLTVTTEGDNRRFKIVLRSLHEQLQYEARQT